MNLIKRVRLLKVSPFKELDQVKGAVNIQVTMQNVQLISCISPAYTPKITSSMIANWCLVSEKLYI